MANGSTTGKLNEEQIFYIKSRGVPQKEAMRLIIDGFVNEVYDKVRQKVPNFKPL
jgi:Fe-S cluster assembly protein SufD